MKYSPYSYSKINTFKNCPYRFKLQYVDKIRTKFNVSPALEKGKFIHYGLEHYLKGTLREKINDYNFQLASSDEIKEYRKQLKQVLLSKDIQWYKSFSDIKTEFGFGIIFKDNDIDVIGYSNKADIRGYIDLLAYDEFSNEVYIIDYKTGKFREEQDKLQVAIYYLVAVKKYPEVENFNLIFNFVEHSKTVEIKYTRDDFQKVLEFVRSSLSKVENADEFPKITTFCNWCPYYNEGHCNGISEENY